MSCWIPWYRNDPATTPAAVVARLAIMPERSAVLQIIRRPLLKTGSSVRLYSSEQRIFERCRFLNERRSAKRTATREAAANRLHAARRRERRKAISCCRPIGLGGCNRKEGKQRRSAWTNAALGQGRNKHGRHIDEERAKWNEQRLLQPGSPIDAFLYLAAHERAKTDLGVTWLHLSD